MVGWLVTLVDNDQPQFSHGHEEGRARTDNYQGLGAEQNISPSQVTLTGGHGGVGNYYLFGEAPLKLAD